MNQRILELAGIKSPIRTEIIEQKEVSFDSKVDFLLEMKMESFDYQQLENGRDERLIKKFLSAPKSIAAVIYESTNTPVYYFMKNGNNCGWLNGKTSENNMTINEMESELRLVMSGHNSSKYFIKVYS